MTAEAQRRLDVELLIIHLTLSPAEISDAHDLTAQIAHCVGDPRRTPKGTALPGCYPDTRWRHGARYEAGEQHFADKIAELVARLEPRKAFLAHLAATGGTATVIVQFLDGYFGDSIPLTTLAKLVELQLELDIESYNVPQT
ncbi:MAG TPA: DUF4279 domain-containing protein [Hyphomicrobiaceae bacterium]|nr:DUF4279 domain-containing protein [Hyphomicrobiaceae bacterium]